LIMRVREGVVVSSACDKTIVVRVDSYVKHPLYEKRVLRSKKFHVHDEDNLYKVGDSVSIVECRPVSKLKRWKVVKG